MVSLEEAVIARLEKHGERFEILIDPDTAQDIKAGGDADLAEGMAAEYIFKDSSKGDRATEENIKKVFGNVDILEVARQIILRGEIQLTQAQRKEMRENKKRQILDVIVRNAINPQTNTPHPRQRLELAMTEAKVHVDPFKGVDEQVKETMTKLKPIIPIKFDTLVMAVRLSPEDYGKCFSTIKDMGQVTRQEWQKDGHWIGIVQIPAGLKLIFFDRLNSRTHGAADIKEVE